MTGREKQSARNAHTVLLRPSLVGALPAVGAEQEEEAELPTDHKVLSVKDPLAATWLAYFGASLPLGSLPSVAASATWL